MTHIKVFVFNMIGVNTYLLYDEQKNAVLIDCGAYSDPEKKELTDFIESEGLQLKRLLNTHLHFDHALGNHFIYEKYGLKPEYNKIEESMPGLKEQCAAFLSPIEGEPAMADRFLNDKDEIVAGDIRLKVLLTPGHSPGSLSFYSENDQCVFTGDALFQSSIGRTDLWEGNHVQLISAIREKLLCLPDQTRVYPGHGPSTTIANEKKYNPYL